MNTLRKRIVGLSLGALALALMAVVALSGLNQTTLAAQAAPTTQAAVTTSAVATSVKAAFANRADKANWATAGKAGEVGQYVMPIVTAVSNTLNLSPMEIFGQLQADKSMADIAKAQNVELSKLKDAITGAVKTQLDAAVKAGKTTQIRADKSNQTLSIWLDELLVAHKSSLPTQPNPQDFQLYAAPILNATAASLNLSPEQLKSELKAGKTFGEIAKAQQVDLQKVKDAILSASQTQLNAAAKAGKFPQAWADKAYQTAVLWIDEVVK